MSRILYIYLTFSLLFGLFACEQTSVPDKNRVYYQIFLRSFADSDGDRIGDLPGLIDRLDYLDELGVEGVWLLPVNPSPSYHKYDVNDYRSIDSIYGSMDDMKTLIAELHARDMTLLVDMVINHTDDEHPWFQEALQGPENPYRDYYCWRPADSIVSEAHLWHQQPADGPVQNNSDELFYGFFWKGMPDLNYDNPKVREEVKEIGRFWLEEVGVDGFRLDGALHIYPFYDGNRAENFPKTVAWWEEYHAAMQAIDPDVFLVGEVWEGDTILAPFLDSGLTAAFNFDLAKNILKTLQDGQDSSDLVAQLIAQRELYAAHRADFVDATFLSNHDQNRVRSELNGDLEKSKLAASLLLTLPGSPFIYYGEELGMQGEKPDENIREPFPWGGPGQTAWRDLIYNPAEITPPLVFQMDDPNSLWRHYKELIRLRKRLPALDEGTIVPWVAGELPLEIVAYKRWIPEIEPVWVAHNISSKPIELALPKDQSFRILWKTGDVSRQQKYTLVLPPLSSVIMQ